METTNGIYNKELFELIQPKCVLMWQRVQVRGEGWIGKGGSSGQRPITSLARLLRRVLVASVLLCLPQPLPALVPPICYRIPLQPGSGSTSPILEPHPVCRAGPHLDLDLQVANFGARGGSEWVDLFARHNSGTYNNQVGARKETVSDPACLPAHLQVHRHTADIQSL
jgi:hypothetical protein